MATLERPTVAIIDPVASGAPYGAECRAIGLSPIGILTCDVQCAYTAQTLRREDFAEIYRHRTMKETISFLKGHGVTAVIPGDQLALRLSDLFAHSLGVAGNPAESVEARVNKRVMKERWSVNGVPCADWFESGDLQAVLSWTRRQGFPVVLKPNASTGSCHVFKCANEREVASAFEVITSEPDDEGFYYDTVLAEEYLDGDEYFINLLHDGRGESRIVSMARYEKIQRGGRASIYRNIRSMALTDPLANEVLPQIKAANAALGVRVGINDTEFKMTSHGLRIIEINNRLPGAGTPLMIHKCSGLNCYQANIRLFSGQRPAPSNYDFMRHYCICCLINDRAGRVVGYEGVEEAASLPSFDSIRFIADMGSYWPATIDLATAWALVWLVNEDNDQLDHDIEAVHSLLRLRVEQ